MYSKNNIARSSKFNINIDYELSEGSFIYDLNTDRKYLDFFGMYASLPLGYNHEIFKTKEFVDEYLRTSSFKVNNCEFTSKETLEFDKQFKNFCGLGKFRFFHYTCTGALAVESAIKTCIDYKKTKYVNVLSFNNSFHGINSYGCFVTSRFPGADKRLDGFPEMFSTKIDFDIEQIEKTLKTENITCVLVEPIQCSVGDYHHDKKKFKLLRTLCDHYDIPLIFDEIQIGFGSTGKLWYFEHVGIIPDIVIFGKKTQLSGIMTVEKMKNIFKKNNSIRLEVTWDGDVSDMIRCKHIIKAYKKYNILENVMNVSNHLVSQLKSIEFLENVRNCGLIIGFDLTNSEKRDTMVKNMYDNGMICNPTGLKSIRFRPNLNLQIDEADLAIDIVKKSI
jgi:L-lysine 6-transaminase